MRFPLRFGILPKLFATMMAITLVPLAAIWYLDYRASVDYLSTNIEERLSAQADGAATFVNGWIDTHLRLLRQNSGFDDIISMDGRRHAPILQAINREYPWIYLAHTIGPDGMNVGRSDKEAPKNYGDRLYFQQAMAGAPLTRQIVIGKTSGQPALILAMPITTKDDRRLGVLSIAMTVEDLTKKVTSFRIGRTGFVFLVDDTGTVIAHPKQRGSLATHPALLALGDKVKNKVVFKENGRDVVAYAQRTDQGWTLVAQQDYAEAYAPIAEANRNAVILLVACLVLVAVLSSVLAPRLTRPIRNLTKIADEISRGRLASHIEETERADEIGGLARAIDRLKSSVEVAMRRLATDQRVPVPEPRDHRAVVGGSAARP